MSNVIIVDQNDNVIGVKPRNDRSKTDIIRVAGLLVFNTKGEMLIAQRSLNKINSPGKWGPAVAGTVEEGETYISNILKEAQEEIGLEITERDLKEEMHSYQETSHKYFSTIFSTIVDKLITDFVIQEEEVEAIQWISKKNLKEWFNEKPEDFISTFKKTIDFIDQR